MRKKTLRGYLIRHSVANRFREACKKRQRPECHIVEDMMIEWMLKAKNEFQDFEEKENTEQKQSS